MNVPFKNIAYVYGDIIVYLRSIFNNKDEMEIFLLSIGWDVKLSDTLLGQISTFINILGDVEDSAQLLTRLKTETLEDKESVLDEFIELLFSIIEKVKSIDTNNLSGFTAPLNQQSFWIDVKDGLINHCLIQYVKHEKPGLYFVLVVLQIIKYEPQIMTSQYRINYTKESVNWNDLWKVVFKPNTLIKDNYHWNSNPNVFDHRRLIDALERGLMAMGAGVYKGAPEKTLADEYLDINSIDSEKIDQLIVTLAHGEEDNSSNYWSLGFSLLPIPEQKKSTQPPKGVLFVPNADFGRSISFALNSSLFLHFVGEISSGNALKVEIFPSGVDLNTTLNSVQFNGQVGLYYQPEEPYTLLQIGDTTRVEIEGLSVDYGVRGTPNDIESIITVNFPKINFIFTPSAGDGFISKMLGTKDFENSLDLTILWSSKTGVSFKGQFTNENNFTLASASHLKISDVINLTNATVVVFFKDGKLGVKLGSGINVDMGVLKIAISEIGIYGAVKPDSSSDTFNFADLTTEFAFSPPTGVGIAVKSSAVSGGGFLKFDYDNHKYLGALELKIKKISLGVIGILRTKLPGGKKGFSLLLIVTVEGFKPIALGFGFSLAGVGGLLGLNRTASIDALRAGLKTGANESILFPKDIVKNIDKIVSDLEACFPEKEGRFLVGPMGKIIWGTPKPLITADIGLIIDLPDPVKLVLLGVIKAALPDDKKPKLLLKISFMGAIDFEKKMISFDASIYDSRILTFEVSGDMAFRLKWGDQPNFLLSVGGFHPAYTPPPLDLPPMNRLAITLVNKNKLKVGLKTYFAITSNTVQFGARVSAYAEAAKFNARGELWLDVLFQFKPFYFIADMGAMVAIRQGRTELLSASLRATLQGPAPWSVRGTAEFKVLGIGFDVSFSEQWGEKDQEKLEDKDVWPEMLEAINHKDNWTVRIPERNQLFVSVKERTSTADNLALHPLGRLAVSQTVAPLNFGMNRFGHAKPKDYSSFKIDSVKGNDTPIAFTYLKDKFPPSKFTQMNDHQKLSRPSFEDFDSGVSIGTDNLVSSHKVLKELTYQKPKIFDRRMRIELTATVYREDIGFVNNVIANSAVNNAFSNPRRSEIPADGPANTTVKPKAFAVANMDDNTAYNSVRFDSMAQAYAYLEDIVKSSPAQKNKLMVANELELV